MFFFWFVFLPCQLVHLGGAASASSLPWIVMINKKLDSYKKSWNQLPMAVLLGLVWSPQPHHPLRIPVCCRVPVIIDSIFQSCFIYNFLMPGLFWGLEKRMERGAYEAFPLWSPEHVWEWGELRQILQMCLEHCQLFPHLHRTWQLSDANHSPVEAWHHLSSVCVSYDM